MQTSDPINAALDVVNVVAIDPPIAKFLRLTSFINRVTRYRRAMCEDVSGFVYRFCGLAAT